MATDSAAPGGQNHVEYLAEFINLGWRPLPMFGIVTDVLDWRYAGSGAQRTAKDQPPVAAD
jgi:hypothetical protein